MLKKWNSVILYFLSGALSIGLAFLLSTQFLKLGQAQNGPNLNQTPPPPIPDNVELREMEKPVVGAAEVSGSQPPPLPKPNLGANTDKAAPSLPIPGQVDVLPPPVDIPVENEVVQGGVKENFDLFLEPYNYDPTSRRDPFVPIRELLSSGLDGKSYGPKTQTEAFDLNQFKLIGVIWNVVDPKAMFLDPNKRVHVLRKNQRIGRNQGYIATIREGEVVVVETTFKAGAPVYSARVVKLSK